jgi:hypothetical protein
MKKLEITEFIGRTIKKYHKLDDKNLVLLSNDDVLLMIQLDDENRGCNDSYAYFGNLSLDGVINSKIIEANDGEYNDWGGILKIETENGSGTIETLPYTLEYPEHPGADSYVLDEDSFWHCLDERSNVASNTSSISFVRNIDGMLDFSGVDTFTRNLCIVVSG